VECYNSILIIMEAGNDSLRTDDQAHVENDDREQVPSADCAL